MTYGRTAPDMTRQREAVARVAPNLSPERVAHWARVIDADTEAGRYTGSRMWEIAADIAVENAEAVGA
jgi:hypothetical protein